MASFPDRNFEIHDPDFFGLYPGYPARWAEIDAAGMPHRQLNERIRELAAGGYRRIHVVNVAGQRYIGTNPGPDRVFIKITGTPGNDLGAFLNGSEIEVVGNAQDGVGNTMSDGQIVVRGDVRDVAGLSMRGGSIFVRGNAGYRCGLHMKEYGDKKPLLVIGGKFQDFLGEYMAGGTIVVFGIGAGDEQAAVGRNVGPGMHGGTIYMPRQLAQRVNPGSNLIHDLCNEDYHVIDRVREKFSALFPELKHEASQVEFVKIIPASGRPYGRLYSH